MLRALAGVTSDEGFRIGLIATTLGFGLRHGIDWDHIAAITDITSSQKTSRTSIVFATLYAIGHGVVVFALGVIAILLGDLLPDGVDSFMERVVGITLLILGVYVFYALIRHGRDFRMRSRWMLIFSGLRRGSRWIRSRVRGGGSVNSPETTLEHEHEHVPGTPHHEDVESATSTLAAVTQRTHGHHHRHAPTRTDDPFMNYGRATSFLVGMIHGVGAETPTQVLIFFAAAGAGKPAAGLFLLVVFIVGLLASNTAIALASTFGYLAAGRSFALYAGVAILTGGMSLVLGSLFLAGKGTLLPAIFGG